MAAHLIDTNVMLAASAASEAARYELSNLANLAMPTDANLRNRVYRALRDFEESDDALVLDAEGAIRDEYDRNMPYNNAMAAVGAQEYGLLVIQKKWDTDRTNIVTIDLDENGHGRLSEELSAIVSDREDRKWVAAALAHAIIYGSTAPIMYAQESDWPPIEALLAPYGVLFRRLLPDEFYRS